MKGTFRKQLLQQLINDEAIESPRSGRTESRPVDENAIRSLCDFSFLNPKVFYALGKVCFLQEHMVNCIFATSSEAQRVALLKFLVQSEIKQKAGSEAGSILRGSGMVEVMLGRHVKLCGATYVSNVMREFASNCASGDDATKVCKNLVDTINKSANDVPASVKVVLASIREECERQKISSK